MKKTVLITGSSRGIGRQTAIGFANEGYNVVINYVSNKEMAENLVEKLQSNGHSCMCIKADVSKKDEVIKMYEQVKSKFGHVDVLVNNAGICAYDLFTDITEAQWDRMFDVNVKGMFNCTQAFLPDMISNKSGRIINISSIWGMVGASCEVSYSASKAAVIGFTKALAKEVGPSNIQVNCVAPGVIETDMMNDVDEETKKLLKEETPLMELGQVEDVANAILFLSCDKSKFITGQVISPNGGYVIS